MQVFKIHSMQWAGGNRSSVKLVADTDTGNMEQIFTPYSEESIIWAAVSAFPVEAIQPEEVVDVMSDSAQ